MNLRTVSSKVNKLSAKENEVWNGLYPRIYFLIRNNNWRWEAVAASFGLGGGILSLIVGIVCDVSARCLTTHNSNAVLKKVSVIAFFLCLPLMFLGAHFLDLLETKYFNEKF